MAKPSLAMTAGWQRASARDNRSIKFYESCAQLLRGVAEGEAVLLGALFHVLGDGHAHGEGGNNEDGEDGERLLHGVQRALMRVRSGDDHHRRACLSSR